jgi:hypothetical protein
VNKPTNELGTYTAQESEAILAGDKLVAPEMLTARWKISQRELHKFVRGSHPSGIRLPALHFGKKTLRFRLADVVKVEHALYNRDG